MYHPSCTSHTKKNSVEKKKPGEIGFYISAGCEKLGGGQQRGGCRVERGEKRGTGGREVPVSTSSRSLK